MPIKFHQITRPQRPPVLLLKSKECRHKRSTDIDICTQYVDETEQLCTKCEQLIDNDVCRRLRYA